MAQILRIYADKIQKVLIRENPLDPLNPRSILI